ncbi:VIN3-like protein 2 isoform X1 [Morus notabilis]|uniref:VIN3-like protein 2 isoform X1 n=1 Tax=Morus notabilis TaxID=981085 RepID=UPI000CED17A9|nr:VIN3-like protein 2 isoform X1 [Morus notabilis]
MATDSSLEGVAHDPSKCSKMSMEKKRELVYEISNWSEGASEMLQSWSRQEILQILCAEMGKERKYTGLTKLKIIEHLLKIVSEKKLGGNEVVIDVDSQSSPPPPGQRSTKRQRKTEQPSRLATAVSNASSNSVTIDLTNIVYCKNSACRATLSREDSFCKRCSCCICYKYDDNKDPSLWLICSSEPPFLGNSCGMSCHLECALKHEKSGIGKEGKIEELDGSFHCVSCGKVNDLLGSWRKQLVMAKETRRVDILCYRVSLSQKLLKGTNRYQILYEIVDEAVNKLEAEVGLLTGLPVKMGRGIVNRLSSGQEVQKLCASALELLDSMRTDANLQSLPGPIIQGNKKSIVPDMIKFEDIQTTSLTVILDCENLSSENNVIYTLWHRKADDINYSIEPTCKVFAPNTRFVVRGLTPGTEYCFKVVSFDGTNELGTCEVRSSTSNGDEPPNCLLLERSQSPATNCSSLSNPSSVEDETNNVALFSDQADNRADNYLTYCKGTEKIVTASLSSGAITCNSEGANLGDAVGDRAVGVVGSLSNSDVLKFENKRLSESQTIEDLCNDNGSNTLVRTGTECVPFVGSSDAGLPITPFKVEMLKDGLGRNGRSKSMSKDLENGTGKGEPQDGSTSKKRSAERPDEECAGNGLSDRDFEYYVKIIRWLECEGHIEKNFRQKFLTWFSLRATPLEVRIVKVFIDTFIEDPASLAGQLVDTFSESISSKRSSVVPTGFCMKLWH